MADSFATLAATLLNVNLGFIGMFVFGPGLTTPVPTSLTPASECVAQLPVYQHVASLQSCLVAVLVASIALCAYVKVELAAVEGEHLEHMDEAARRLLRACLLLGVVTSAASVAMGLATYVYVFQVKVMVLSCVSEAARAALAGTYVLATVVCGLVYYKFARVAIFSN
ncbi:uncharacterized protein LOC120670597 [Panicum virgatum]|uniref:Uncharacterized protein n=1 Tax=Panicum virgatum TaxID=38727 RepID=A0A8T0T4K6_PANVG|nr:uncharacterized protein LOC120670597 [Panicum virgatum]KAG2604135.1 hypothetical protein PVAP13_4NG047600 [Panicum virgatum]